MILQADEPASPACLAHEADEAYMGFATREEITRFLAELDAAPNSAKAQLLRNMLPKIRDDVLHAEIKARLVAIEAGESST